MLIFAERNTPGVKFRRSINMVGPCIPTVMELERILKSSTVFLPRENKYNILSYLKFHFGVWRISGVVILQLTVICLCRMECNLRSSHKHLLLHVWCGLLTVAMLVMAALLISIKSKSTEVSECPQSNAVVMTLQQTDELPRHPVNVGVGWYWSGLHANFEPSRGFQNPTRGV